MLVSCWYFVNLICMWILILYPVSIMLEYPVYSLFLFGLILFAWYSDCKDNTLIWESIKISVDAKSPELSYSFYPAHPQPPYTPNVTYFHVMTILYFSEPFVFMLTVISCGLAENRSFVSQLFSPSKTDLKLRTSTPWWRMEIISS